MVESNAVRACVGTGVRSLGRRNRMMKTRADDVESSQHDAALQQMNMRCVRESFAYCCWHTRRLYPGAERLVTAPPYKEALISCKSQLTAAQINRPQYVLEGQMFDL